MGQGLTFWRLIFIVTVIVTVTAALYPNFKLSSILYGFNIDDAVIHMSAFATVTSVAAYAWRLSLAMLVFLAFFAVTLELGQAYSPGRDVDLSDAMASLAGIALGALVPIMHLRFRRTLLG